MSTRLHVTSNQDVIDAAAEALWNASKRADEYGPVGLADVLMDIYAMLFVEVDDK